MMIRNAYRHGKISHGLAAVALLLFVLSACGKGSDGTNSGSVKYYLEQAATTRMQNTLIVEVQGEFKPRFSLTGSGYTADIPLDEIQDHKEETALSVSSFGEVFIELTLYQENDQAYLTDKLSWKSSGEVPPAPDIYFSENASADAYVYMVLPSDRGPNVQEVWVEGDLESSVSAGKYYPIPADDQVLIQLSEGDGMKNLRVKYRNIFGTESVMVDASVERKSIGPASCQVKTVASKSANGYIRTRIQAVNEGPLYYKVTGDVALEKDFIAFEDSIDELIALSAGEGQKRLTFKIKDAAGNLCDDIQKLVDFDRSYRPGGLTIKDDLIWTDDPAVAILPQFDFLEGDSIEMHISGNILDEAHTFEWIPFQEEINVTLSPSAGTRHIIVQYRKDETLVSEVEKPIFLRPFILVSGTAPNQTLIPSQILGSTSMTITGCTQTYVNIAYTTSLPCTKNAAEAIVTYYLSDGTNVVRSVAL